MPSYLPLEHEYSLDGGTTWADCTSTTVTVGNVALAINQVQVRVKATSSHPAGLVLGNATAFTLTGTPLAAPASPQATGTSASTMSVTASSVSGATGYHLFRSLTSTGTFAQVGGTLSTPSYADSGLSGSTTYYYQWQALGNGTTTADSPRGTTFSGTTQTVTSGPPTLAGVSPTSAEPGEWATVTGTGLLDTPGSRLTLNGVEVRGFACNSDTTLVFFVPNNATSGDLVHTTSHGTSTALAFTVNAPVVPHLMPRHDQWFNNLRRVKISTDTGPVTLRQTGAFAQGTTNASSLTFTVGSNKAVGGAGQSTNGGVLYIQVNGLTRIKGYSVLDGQQTTVTQAIGDNLTGQPRQIRVFQHSNGRQRNFANELGNTGSTQDIRSDYLTDITGLDANGDPATITWDTPPVYPNVDVLIGDSIQGGNDAQFPIITGAQVLFRKLMRPYTSVTLETYDGGTGNQQYGSEATSLEGTTNVAALRGMCVGTDRNRILNLYGFNDTSKGVGAAQIATEAKAFAQRILNGPYPIEFEQVTIPPTGNSFESTLELVRVQQRAQFATLPQAGLTEGHALYPNPVGLGDADGYPSYPHPGTLRQYYAATQFAHRFPFGAIPRNPHFNQPATTNPATGWAPATPSGSSFSYNSSGSITVGGGAATVSGANLMAQLVPVSTAQAMDYWLVVDVSAVTGTAQLTGSVSLGGITTPGRYKVRFSASGTASLGVSLVGNTGSVTVTRLFLLPIPAATVNRNVDCTDELVGAFLGLDSAIPIPPPSTRSGGITAVNVDSHYLTTFTVFGDYPTYRFGGFAALVNAPFKVAYNGLLLQDGGGADLIGNPIGPNGTTQDYLPVMDTPLPGTFIQFLKEDTGGQANVPWDRMEYIHA